jgi:exodeoxyribonuclease-5
MELTRKQEEGLKIAVARYKAHEPYTCIAGYAGTGKSTLIKFIVAALNMYEEEVAYIAFTGKASEVLREKGCPNAQTAHRLLYYSKQMPNGKFVYKPRPHIEYSLIVVDEVSMLPIDMWELLLSHGVYVIACGDPFQLPPVDKTKENHILDNPHIFLDEVMRQAKESDIIVTSMNIREGKSIVPMRGNDTQIFRKQELVAGMYGWADEILVATNKNRFDIN